ncbi:transcriptional regulator [Pasteurellaceae bacterium LFhippo2]|nr:transcriptional regulator [Pasteurellaceae bacterium LFhippo2]
MSQQTMSLLRECIPVCTVLSDENRHKILKLLFDNGAMNVNQLTEQLHLSRPAVSHHLKIMLQANVVTVEQIGKERFYSISMRQELAKLKALVNSMESDCLKS